MLQCPCAMLNREPHVIYVWLRNIKRSSPLITKFQHTPPIFSQYIYENGCTHQQKHTKITGMRQRGVSLAHNPELKLKTWVSFRSSFNKVLRVCAGEKGFKG